jgi:DNA/RNA-binding domain of Phe-tRNA-synthetase-like protein
MTAFQYHPEIISRFPDVVGGVLVAQGMRNGPTPDGLKDVYRREQLATIKRIGSTPLSEIETLAAWRSAFRGFGVNPTRYRSAAEALLRRLTKKGDIPNINAIVDICNLVSIRYGLPVAAFDTRMLNVPIMVQFSDGSERFTPLFQKEYEHPEPGEVIFADEEMLVVARRWCWRQSDESATQPHTTDAVFTVESQHPGGQVDIEAALRDLKELLEVYVGGDCEMGVLNAECLGF